MGASECVMRLAVLVADCNTGLAIRRLRHGASARTRTFTVCTLHPGECYEIRHDRFLAHAFTQATIARYVAWDTSCVSCLIVVDGARGSVVG
jgi:hypothetical protein